MTGEGVYYGFSWYFDGVLKSIYQTFANWNGFAFLIGESKLWFTVLEKIWSNEDNDLWVLTLGARKSTTSQMKVDDRLFHGLRIEIIPWVGGMREEMPLLD